MAIKYCSWATGSDDTGDGSYGNPYKTIQKASTGLGGGDEVRVAKSPDNTDLSGTLAFTQGSTAVVGTNTAFTTELALGDFIKGGDGNWWEVVTITDDTHATLYQKYSGDSCSEINSQKMGLLCTGASPNTAYSFQEISASGSASGCDFHLNGYCKDFPNDIRFTDDDKETELDHWLEQVVGSYPNRVAYFWVKVADDLGSNRDIYCYYGKDGASSASNGANTFLSYTGWESGELENWTIQNGGGTGSGSVVSLHDKYQLKLYAPDSSNRVQAIKSFSSSGAGYCLETGMETGSTVGDGICIGFSDGSMKSASDDQPNNAYYVEIGRGGNSYSRLSKMVSGTYTILVGMSGSVILPNTYYRFGFAWIGNTLKYFLNRSLRTNITDSSFSSLSHIFLSNSLNDKYFDFCFVRKYVSTEPAFSSAGEEEIPADELPGYSYRRKISLNGSTGAGTGYQVLLKVGESSGSFPLRISGGWDLSTQTQTGVTNFQQLHGTFANRWGAGLYVNGKSYVKVEKLNFFRYNYGIRVNSSSDNVFSSSTYNSNVYGIHLTSSNNNVLSSPICNSNTYGIYLTSSNANILSSPICNSNSNTGIYLSSSHSSVLYSPICNYNTYGIYLTSSNANILSSPICNSNAYGIYLTSSSNNNRILGTLSTSSNATAGFYSDAGLNYVNKAILTDTTKLLPSFGNFTNSCLFINNIGGYSQIWTDGGNIVSQDATAGGSGIEWRFNVTSSNRNSLYPLSMEVARVAVKANKQVTVKLYFKKSSIGIAGDLFLRGGQIAGVDDDVKTTCPDNTNRNQVQIQFTPTEKGVVAIEARAWYVSSTTDYLIIDDIDISQAD